MTATSPVRGRYIPWLFVAGFAVVVAVNAVMVWFAVGSFSGLYAAKPRDRGLRFNEVVAEQAARDRLGWRVETEWRREAGGLHIAVFDAAGQPLAGAAVRAELVRPVEKRPPLALVLAATDIGRFAARPDLPARGSWDLDIVVERGAERFALTRRMFLP